MKNIILTVLFSVVLAGCGKDKSVSIPPPASAETYVKCADVYNDGSTSHCATQPVAWVAVAVICRLGPGLSRQPYGALTGQRFFTWSGSTSRLFSKLPPPGTGHHAGRA